VRTEGKSGPVPDQEVHAKGVPVDEGETAKLRLGEDEVQKRSAADEETSELRLGDDEGEDDAEREHRE
jgi:hypothetical protein